MIYIHSLHLVFTNAALKFERIHFLGDYKAHSKASFSKGRSLIRTNKFEAIKCSQAKVHTYLLSVGGRRKKKKQ